MFKVVLDTNIIVSALLKLGSKPELILRLFFDRYAKLCFSHEILEEYQGVLSRDKFRRHITKESLETFFTLLLAYGHLIIPTHKVNTILADPSDNVFLECAWEAQADFLVTGNTRHFPFKTFHKTKVASPDEFLQVIARML